MPVQKVRSRDAANYMLHQRPLIVIYATSISSAHFEAKRLPGEPSLFDFTQLIQFLTCFSCPKVNSWLCQVCKIRFAVCPFRQGFFNYLTRLLGERGWEEDPLLICQRGLCHNGSAFPDNPRNPINDNVSYLFWIRKIYTLNFKDNLRCECKAGTLCLSCEIWPIYPITYQSLPREAVHMAICHMIVLRTQSELFAWGIKSSCSYI